MTGLEPPQLGTGQSRVAGASLALAAVLVLAYAASFLVDDRDGALVLLLLFAVVTLPVLGAAVLSAGPVLALLRGGPVPRRTAVCAGLLAVGHVGVALVALRPGIDRALSTGDQLFGALGGVGLLAALVALALTLPGRPTATRVLLAVSGGVLVLALVVLQAVARTR